jgi:hypothetical protein
MQLIRRHEAADLAQRIYFPRERRSERHRRLHEEAAIRQFNPDHSGWVGKFTEVHDRAFARPDLRAKFAKQRFRP